MTDVRYYHVTYVFLVVVQILLIAAPTYLYWRYRTDYRSRWFHPLNALGAFYFLWYIVPQIYYVYSGGYVHDMGQYDAPTLLRVGIATQWYLIVFMAIVYATAFAFDYMTSYLIRTPTPAIDFSRCDWPIYQIFAYFCLFCGVGATVALGRQFMTMDGMRSALVKTTSGQILTSIMYYGMYGFAFLMSDSLWKRRWWLVGMLVVGFGVPVFFTGSRGRFLFPLVLSIIFFATRKKRLLNPSMIAAGVLCLLIVAFSDQFLMAMRSDQETRLDSGWVELFEKRNFDGYANMIIVVHSWDLQTDLSVLYRGARNPFMYYYFPDVYEQGVAFGTGIPSYAWIAGYLPMMIIIAMVYGLMMGGLDLILRRTRSPQIYWSYLLSLTWMCAVGSSFIEAADKMMISVSPPIVAYLLGHITIGRFQFAPSRIRSVTRIGRAGSVLSDVPLRDTR